MKTAMTWLMTGALVLGIVGIETIPAAAVTVYKIRPHGMAPVSFAALPGPAKTTILNEAGNYMVTNIQRGHEGNRVVYSAQWTASGNTVKILVGASGSLLSKTTHVDNP